jgi:hypothetical protein
MIGRKAIVGLSLLCAFLFSAFSAQGVSAASATNTTAFACVKVAAGATGEFEDAHCDRKVSTKDGYTHQLINGKTQVETTNETTGGAKSTGILEASPFKVATRIECSIASGEGTFENTEPSAKVHSGIGSGSSKFSNCTVIKPVKCTTKEIVAKIGSGVPLEGLTGPNGEANAMGGELQPEAGKPFATITLEGAECALNGLPFPVEGSAIATNGPGTAEAQNRKWTGGTAVYTPAMSNLVAGGRPATISITTTVKMKGGGDTIVGTTVT